MCMSVHLHVCICAICVSGTHRGQKMVPHTLKVMLQVVVSQNVGVRTQTQVYCKSNKCSQLWSHLSNPIYIYI